MSIEMSGSVFQCLVPFYDLLSGVAETDVDAFTPYRHLERKALATLHLVPVQGAQIHRCSQHVEHIRLFRHERRVDFRTSGRITMGMSEYLLLVIGEADVVYQIIVVFVYPLLTS